MKTLSLSLGFLLVLCLALPRLAHAQANVADKAREEQARQYFDAGKQAAQKGQYSIAIVAFEEAYRRAPRASVVYALAYSYRQQWVIDRDTAKLRRAIELWRAYLDLPENDKRSKAVEYLAELEPELRKAEEEAARTGKGAAAPVPPAARTTLIVSSPVEGARVVFDGGAERETPAVIDTQAGRHKLRLLADGYLPAERDAVAVDGQVVAVEVRLEARPATLIVRSAGAAEVAVDGKIAGANGRPLSLSPGRHRVAVLQRGRYAWERDLELGRGATVDVDAPLRVTTQRKVAWYFLIGGGALLAAGATTGTLAYVAQHDAQDYNDRQAHGQHLSPGDLVDYNDAIDRRDTWRTTTYVLAGAGVAAATTGALLYFIDTPQVGEEGGPTPALTPMLSASAVGFAWTRSF